MTRPVTAAFILFAIVWSTQARGAQGADSVPVWFLYADDEGTQQKRRGTFRAYREGEFVFRVQGVTMTFDADQLIRVRFGSIKLPRRLKRGKSMELSKEEVERLLELSS